MTKHLTQEGKIIKGIGGFYYVHVPEMGVYTCRAKGLFRNQGIKPLIGDNVTIDVIDASEQIGSVVDIHERKNALVRPTVSNVDQVVVMFAIKAPKPNLGLLDQFLIAIEQADIESIICFNKTDLDDADLAEDLKNLYEHAGYPVFMTSVSNEDGLLPLRDSLYHKTTAFAGPSGVGKSSFLNEIQSVMHFETGAISEKIGRGKHTTRHAELICFSENSYVVDTPGFSTLEFDAMDTDHLKNYYREFTRYEDLCRFQGCHHVNEPDCGVKTAIETGDIDNRRYQSYLSFYNTLKSNRRW